MLRTEQLLAAPAPETAYRLVLAPDELDCSEFTDLVNSGLLAPPRRPPTGSRRRSASSAAARSPKWPTRSSRCP